MTYAPELKWTPGERTTNAACLTCRWSMTGVSIADIRIHAIRHPRHRVEITSLAKTVVVYEPPGRSAPDGKREEVPDHPIEHRPPATPVRPLSTPTDRRSRPGLRRAAPTGLDAGSPAQSRV